MKRLTAIGMLMVFCVGVDAQPTVTPPVYKFGGCGTVAAGEHTVPREGEEYSSHYNCRYAFYTAGPAACHNRADFYRQELWAGNQQQAAACDQYIDRWEQDCKQFVVNAANYCDVLKKSGELLNEQSN